MMWHHRTRLLLTAALALVGCGSKAPQRVETPKPLTRPALTLPPVTHISTGLVALSRLGRELDRAMACAPATYHALTPPRTASEQDVDRVFRVAVVRGDRASIARLEKMVPPSARSRANRERLAHAKLLHAVALYDASLDFQLDEGGMLASQTVRDQLARQKAIVSAHDAIDALLPKSPWAQAAATYAAAVHMVTARGVLDSEVPDYASPTSTRVHRESYILFAKPLTQAFFKRNKALAASSCRSVLRAWSEAMAQFEPEDA